MKINPHDQELRKNLFQYHAYSIRPIKSIFITE